MTELVALNIPPGPAFVRHLQEVWDAGDVVLPVDHRLPKVVANRLMTALGASAVIELDDERIRFPVAVKTVVEPGDALVIGTSGTTGEPNGAVLTHDAIDASSRMTSARLGLQSDDKWLACLPVAHIGGLSVITRALTMGTPFSVLERFDVTALEREVRAGATLVSLVPTALQRIDPGLFRKILLGGAAPPSHLPDNVVSTYGMTETASGIVYDGFALDGVQLRCSTSGELMVRSPTLLRCYSDGSDPRMAHGWFATGDAGALADDGRVEVFGRIDDVINTGGQKVWPVAVERVLNSHPAISASLVVGEPSPEWGQQVVAYVELAPNHLSVDPNEIREHSRAELASYAVPKVVNVVDHLERTPSGKVMRPKGRVAGGSI